jgi:hypothetical protein
MLTLKKIGSNQTEVRTSDSVILFSYETPVAAIIDGKRFATTTKWSVTTSKHINRWIAGYPVEKVDQDFFWSLV